MSRVFTDRNLLSWEAFATGGRFGLPERAKIVFNCLTHQDERARFVIYRGHSAEAEEAVAEMPHTDLLELLASSRELD